MPLPANGPAPTPSLLGLPKPIRKIIYEYALTYDHSVPLRKRKYHHFWRSGGYASLQGHHVNYHFTPPLLRASLRIEWEATPIFFACNTFKIEVPDGNLRELLAWLRDTPAEYLRLVKGEIVLQMCLHQLDLSLEHR